MNYDTVNKVHEYWESNICKYLSNKFNSPSFEDYIKRFAYLPSGKWIREYNSVKLWKLTTVVDAVKFAKKYKDICVTYNSPSKPEDGIGKAIYQFSQHIHVEASFWIWMEHDIVNSYASLLICYHNEKELAKFKDRMTHFKKTGNTEDKINSIGFALGDQRNENWLKM